MALKLKACQYSSYRAQCNYSEAIRCCYILELIANDCNGEPETGEKDDCNEDVSSNFKPKIESYVVEPS